MVYDEVRQRLGNESGAKLGWTCIESISKKSADIFKKFISKKEKVTL